MEKFAVSSSSPSGDQFTLRAEYADLLKVDYMFFIGDKGPETVRWDLFTSSPVPANSSFGSNIVLVVEYLFRIEHSNDVIMGCGRTSGGLLKSCSSDVAAASWVRSAAFVDPFVPVLIHL